MILADKNKLVSGKALPNTMNTEPKSVLWLWNQSRNECIEADADDSGTCALLTKIASKGV